LTLLGAPDIENALEPEILKEFTEDKPKFTANALEWTNKYAK
jgi:hypothetical protein